MDINREADFLKRLMKGISAQFGSNCEVVLHDMGRPYDETIVATENSHVTGRKVGEGGSELVLRALKEGSKVSDQYGYLTKTPDGKLLRSSSVYLRDETGKISGVLGINFDIADFMKGAAAFQSFAPAPSSDRTDIDTIPKNVEELLSALIDESCEMVGKPAGIMTKEDKIRAIRYLDHKGAFLIKKSGDKVSEHFGISKYTLYNYMGLSA